MTEQALRDEMVTAWKSGDKFKKDVLSSVLSTAKKIAIDSKLNITDDIINNAIQKELKTAKEQVESCPSNREDLMLEYSKRLSILNEFAPKMLTKNEIMEIIEKDFSNEVGTKNKGLIMKAVMPIFKGRANGKDVSEVVEEICKE